MFMTGLRVALLAVYSTEMVLPVPRASARGGLAILWLEGEDSAEPSTGAKAASAPKVCTREI